MQRMAELSPASGGPAARGVPRPVQIVLHCLAATLVAALLGCVNSHRTPGGWLDDEAIERMASRRIDEADERLAISHVNVVSYDGIVLLTGQVEDQGLRGLAEDAIREIDKIRKIHNEIQIGGAISLVARTNDNWLQTKVKAQLLADKDVEASRIKVFVEDGVAYLIGVVAREQADAAVAIARNVFGIQRVVKVFDYVEDNSS